MLLLKNWYFPLAFLILIISGCSEKKTPDAVPKETLSNAPGKHCFEYSDDILELKVTFKLDENNNVKGYQTGTITNDAVGYYTSYTSTFEGVLEGNLLKVAVTTRIEGDTQETDQEWKLEGDKLYNRANILTKIKCK